MTPPARTQNVARVELTRQSPAGAIELRWSTSTRGVSVGACNERIIIQVGDAALVVPIAIARQLRTGIETALRVVGGRAGE